MSSEFSWVPWAIAAIGVGLSFLTFYGGWVMSRARGESAADSAKEAHVEIKAAKADLHARIDGVVADLASFKEHVARDYASNRSLEQMERRLVDAINRLGDRLDKAFERFGKE